jgi:hypothetical protein
METCTFDLKMSNTFFTRSIYVGCVWYGSGCGCVLVEWILWESRIRFTKTFGKTVSSGCVKWIREWNVHNALPFSFSISLYYFLLFFFFFLYFPFSFFLILFLFSSYLHRKAHARHRRGLIHSSCRGAQERPVRGCSSPHGPRRHSPRALADAQHATSNSARQDPRPAAPRGLDSRPTALHRRPSRSAPATSPRRTTPPPQCEHRPPDSCTSSSTALLPSSSPPPARLPSPDYSASTAQAPSAGLLRLQLHYAAAVVLNSYYMTEWPN